MIKYRPWSRCSKPNLSSKTCVATRRFLYALHLSSQQWPTTPLQRWGDKEEEVEELVEEHALVLIGVENLAGDVELTPRIPDRRDAQKTSRPTKPPLSWFAAIRAKSVFSRMLRLGRSTDEVPMN